MRIALSTKATVFLTIAWFGAANEARKEIHPLTGHWVPAANVRNGVRTEQGPYFRHFIKITGRGNALVASFWTCGEVNNEFAEGKMVFEGDEILLYRENWATGERDPNPNGKLFRLANGRLGFDLPLEDKVVRVEFERESNAETLFDLFGWT